MPESNSLAFFKLLVWPLFLLILLPKRQREPPSLLKPSIRRVFCLNPGGFLLFKSACEALHCHDILFTVAPVQQKKNSVAVNLKHSVFVYYQVNNY